ncbi:hypothetical protein HanLR1_Chr13g0479321 [Helianthus annuus]|nr:hypothetical protein HanHA89_Chr13g0509371 [Helianthus annuus]KAJ0663261.1 hypothetical protein HanLR1_Chr13g0479321 [Helianthus annuus]
MSSLSANQHVGLLFLLLLALQGTTSLSVEWVAFTSGCVDVFVPCALQVVLSGFGFGSGGMQFPLLDKQSSTKTDSHSMLISPSSCILKWVQQ